MVPRLNFSVATACLSRVFNELLILSWLQRTHPRASLIAVGYSLRLDIHYDWRDLQSVAFLFTGLRSGVRRADCRLVGVRFDGEGVKG